MNRLRYGTDSAIDLEFEEGVLLGAFGCPAGKPLDSVEKAVTAALNEPLGYPALAQCITPSDRIVLALEPGVPQVAEVTTAVIQALLDANIHPDGITVLQTQAAAEAGNDPCRLLDASIRSDVTLEVHAPDERDRLGN